MNTPKDPGTVLTVLRDGGALHYSPHNTPFLVDKNGNVVSVRTSIVRRMVKRKQIRIKRGWFWEPDESLMKKEE